MDKKRLVTVVILLCALAIAAAGFVLLPETLTVQISFSGEPGTTLPKLLGLAIPFALCAVFAVLYVKNEEGSKNLLVSLIGLALLVVTVVFNLNK